MKNKTNFPSKSITLFLGLLSVTIFLIYKSKNSNPAKTIPIIAMTDIIEHPVFETERQGFKKRLKELGYIEGKNISFIHKSAQGNLAVATQITTSFVSLSPKMIVAFSTPSAQAALIPCRQHKIPLLFSTVTDPVGSKLIFKGQSQKNDSVVTGVSDAIDMRTQLQVIQLFFKDVKKIATLYNAGESNSVTSIDALQKEATKKNISVVLSAVSKTSEIEGAVRYLASLGIKILYIPNDNMVVSAMHLVSKLAHANDMIVVAADDGSVKMGADFAYAQNRGKLGEKLGDLANKILKNEKDLSLDNTYATSEELILYVNKKSLSKFKIPDKFKSVIMY